MMFRIQNQQNRSYSLPLKITKAFQGTLPNELLKKYNAAFKYHNKAQFIVFESVQNSLLCHQVL